MESRSVSPILATAVAGVLIAHAGPAASDQPSAVSRSEVLNEVVVTAQRRAENIQDVPITVQALTSEALANLHAATLTDFLQYLPNVTQASIGPGQGNIYVRGLAYGAGGTQSSGTAGDLPTVAVYLDDQAAQLPGRNLDIYAADLERIEMLEGPQGTLFGGGAQAGVIRYITNKPKIDVLEGGVDASYGTTAHGDPNSSLTAVLNLPLIPGKLAVRGVIFNDLRGGYIDNVPSVFARSGYDLGLAYRNGGTVLPGGTVVVPGQVPADSEVLNNYALAHRAQNPLKYQGARFSAHYRWNDDWDAILTQTYQDMDAQGVFYENPIGSDGKALPPLSVSLFNDSYNKDKFSNTALTVNGKIGPLKATYSGAYLTRNVHQVQDYTNYARGVWATYYQCTGYSTGYDPVKKCYSPSATWYEIESNTHQSHEFRVSTPQEARVRAMGGVYWDDYKIYDQTDWLERSVPQCDAATTTECFLNIHPWAGAPANNPNVRSASDGFFEDAVRDYRQLAEFLSVDVDLIPHRLTLTAGTRHFRYDSDEKGSVVSSFGCKVYAGNVATDFGPCRTQSGTNLGNLPQSSAVEAGFRSRIDLSYRPMEGKLIFLTWSQGFRPGGFNQSTGRYLPDANGVPQFILPPTYKSDDLTNLELGWKTEWFGRRLQINGAIYQEDWKNQQVGFFDPQGGLGNVAFQTNGPSYRVKGLEVSVDARPVRGLSVGLATTWNSSAQTNSPYLVNNNPDSPNFGQNITSIPNPYGPLGSPLPNSPAFSGNLHTRYEWSVGGDATAFWQLSASHRAHSFSATGYVNANDQPAYSTFDGAVGVAKGDWSVEFVGQNLTDCGKSSSLNSSQFILMQTPIRPRVLSLKVGYHFGGH